MDLPKFILYGQGDQKIEENMQPALAFRSWGELSSAEKQIAFQELKNSGWVDPYSREILETIAYLNHTFLRQCPGKNLHKIKPEHDIRGRGNESELMEAAVMDFYNIFLQEKSDDMVFRMLSKFTECYIDGFDYRRAAEVVDEEERKKLIEQAFDKFDRLANCINHIFEQFAVNQVVTRNGFVPRQDNKITESVYNPILKILADPKWISVSADLAKMFEDYRNEKYQEAITKAHSALHRFLQILVGQEGKSAKGEVGELFRQAKEKDLIRVNRFTEPFVDVIQRFIVSERATNSTAKPTLKTATPSDALLMMNLVMIFLQYSLQGQ